MAVLDTVLRRFFSFVVVGLVTGACARPAIVTPLSEDMRDRAVEARDERKVGAPSPFVAPQNIAKKSDRPIVMVFFATWCDLCSYKLETVRRATTEVGGADVVLVAVDDDKTKHHVPGFLREHRMLHAPVIDGLSHPDFVSRFNPASALPFVLVVDNDGRAVDAQVGLRSGDGQRLENSLRLAMLD